jgi:hypothetical protein
VNDVHHNSIFPDFEEIQISAKIRRRRIKVKLCRLVRRMIVRSMLADSSTATPTERHQKVTMCYPHSSAPRDVVFFVRVVRTVLFLGELSQKKKNHLHQNVRASMIKKQTKVGQEENDAIE